MVRLCLFIPGRHVEKYVVPEDDSYMTNPDLTISVPIAPGESDTEFPEEEEEEEEEGEGEEVQSEGEEGEVEQEEVGRRDTCGRNEIRCCCDLAVFHSLVG